MASMATQTSEAGAAAKSRFGGLEQLPFDEAYRVMAAFEADPSPDKISLGAGVYRDEEAQPWTLPSVERAIAQLPDNHDYLAQDGFAPFVSAAQELLFGDVLPDISSRLATVQTIAGTGACRVGTRLLVEQLQPGAVWIADLTWINHSLMWSAAEPQVPQKRYPYYDPDSKSFDFEGTMAKLEAEAQPGDVILLQACAHNPTGLDPTREQWACLATLCARRGLLPFFDCAYQGFASGDPSADAWVVRHFASHHLSLELVVAQSFSKNFGLYGERVGALHVLASASAVVSALQTHLVRIIRSEVSSGVAFGARIVAAVMGDEELRGQWREDLRSMSGRISGMRKALKDELERRGTPGSWNHIVEQIGMFSYTGLSKEQSKKMGDEHHIYLLSSGRISVPGLNPRNVGRVAAAMDAVIRDTGTGENSA